MLVNIDNELYEQIRDIKINYDELMCDQEKALQYCIKGTSMRDCLSDDDDSIMGAHMDWIEKLIQSIMNNNFDTPEMKFEWDGISHLAFTDEVGGFHCDGVGINPLGERCGECLNSSCKNCGNRFYSHHKEK